MVGTRCAGSDLLRVRVKLQYFLKSDAAQRVPTIHFGRGSASRRYDTRSKRSRFMTLFQAATKSLTNLA